MKRLFFRLSMLTVLALLLSMLSVLPAAALSGVYDEAEIFTADEADALNHLLIDLEEQTDTWQFAIVTTNDAEGKSAQDYADDRWDADYYPDGALVLYDFDNGEVYISCSGDAMALYSDARIEAILDEMFEFIPDDRFFDSACAFVESAQDFYQSGPETDDPIYHVMPGETAEDFWNDPEYEYIEEDHIPQNSLAGFLVIFVPALIAGAICGGIAVGAAAAKYRLKFPDRSYVVAEHAQLKLTDRRSDRIGHIVTTRVIPKHDDDDHDFGGGGGGTTIHHSSSGRVHSGGGRSM